MPPRPSALLPSSAERPAGHRSSSCRSANATGDPQQEYFTDAVTADLTVDLSRMRDITVISTASALTYKGNQIDPRRLACELRVRCLIVGAIARTRELVRTNV